MVGSGPRVDVWFDAVVLLFPRDALTKMKDVYVKNPAMGDPASVDPRLGELAQSIEKLQYEVQKFEVRLHTAVPAASPWRPQPALLFGLVYPTQRLRVNSWEGRRRLPQGGFPRWPPPALPF